jgi:hypothetical protein
MYIFIYFGILIFLSLMLYHFQHKNIVPMLDFITKSIVVLDVIVIGAFKKS